MSLISKTTVIFIFVLLLTLISSISNANQEQKALRYISKAVIKHYNINNYLRKWEKKHIDEDYRKIGGWIFWITKIGIDKKISYTWYF